MAWRLYFEEFPDYLTQGDNLQYLEEHLRDLYSDLTSGQIPEYAVLLSCPSPREEDGLG
jgi:hypothetical protein